MTDRRYTLGLVSIGLILFLGVAIGIDLVRGQWRDMMFVPLTTALIVAHVWTDNRMEG